MFVDMCWDRGITPVLMTQANRLVAHLDPDTWTEVKVLEAQGISYAEFREMYKQFNQTIRDLGVANEVLVVDLDREILPERRFIHDPVHLTERGSKLAAKIISRELKPLVQEKLQDEGGDTPETQDPAASSGNE